MEVFKEIEKYLNSKLNSSKEIITKEITIITGVNEEIVDKKIDLLNPTFIVTKDILKIALDMDLYNLPIEDIRLIEYFLDIMKDKEKLYISSNVGENKNPSRFNVKTNDDEILNISYEQNIYGGAFSNDINYIAHILMTLGIKLKNEIMYLSTSNLKIPNIEKVYSLMLTNLAIMVTINLHENNIYIFDNKHTSQTPECMSSSLESYFLDFYETFKDIIPLFLTNLREFINIVGEENFQEFVSMISEDNLCDISETLNKMYMHKLNYQNGTYINVDLITKSLKKYKQKEK